MTTVFGRLELCFWVVILVAGCRPSGTPEAISPTAAASPNIAESQSSENDANAPSYHGRTLRAWRQRAAEQDPTARAEAVEALGQIAGEQPGEDILPELVRALGDRDAGVVRKAQDALQSLVPDSLPALIKGLSAADPEVRSQVALALEEVGPEATPAIGPLVTALSDPDANVRSNAMNALVEIGPEAVPALVGALEGETSSLREHAARTLRKMGTAAKDAVPALLKALEDDSVDVHTAVSSALYAVDREAAEKAGLK